jgi:hypothetical protein
LKEAEISNVAEMDDRPEDQVVSIRWSPPVDPKRDFLMLYGLWEPYCAYLRVAAAWGNVRGEEQVWFAEFCLEEACQYRGISLGTIGDGKWHELRMSGPEHISRFKHSVPELRIVGTDEALTHALNRRWGLIQSRDEFANHVTIRAKIRKAEAEDYAADMRWVYANLANDNASKVGATAGAWAMLQWARQSVRNRDTFLRKFLSLFVMPVTKTSPKPSPQKKKQKQQEPVDDSGDLTWMDADDDDSKTISVV